MTPTIPQGWRKLRVGTEIKRGDVILTLDTFFPASSSIGCKYDGYRLVIRRIRKGK